jgi:NAD(P)-dependent dehydrogenase (short-subunit alcohol dehydrogenase family)
MMPVEFDVTGKVVLITGAGRGIGKGIAQVLAEAGADIALNALTSGEERFRQSTRRASETVPPRRPGRLREVGYLALYLASAVSDYMTGQTILLDGGLSL